MEETIHFDEIKEDRGWYYVVYRPPMPSFRFSILHLMIPGDALKESIAEAMECEAQEWVKRYAIPVMVSSFDKKGDLIDLVGIRNCTHLMVFTDNGEISVNWELLKDEQIPDIALERDYLLTIFKDINYTTSSELKVKADKRLAEQKLGWFIVFIWAAVVPVIVMTLEFFSPEWLAVIVFIYSLYKAYIKAMKLLGKISKTPQELAAEEEERKMRHHHYHCELNPEGFQKLKFENFDRESVERIKNESIELKRNNETKG